MGRFRNVKSKLLFSFVALKSKIKKLDKERDNRNNGFMQHTHIDTQT